MNNDTEDRKAYSTMDDVRDYVRTTLGDAADDYDVDAIADALTEWRDGKLTLKVDEPFDAAYWDVVASHDIASGLS